MLFFRNLDPRSSTELNRKKVVIPRENVDLWLEVSGI